MRARTCDGSCWRSTAAERITCERPDTTSKPSPCSVRRSKRSDPIAAPDPELPEPAAAALTEADQAFLHHAGDGLRPGDQIRKWELAFEHGPHVVAEDLVSCVEDGLFVLDRSRREVQAPTHREGVADRSKELGGELGARRAAGGDVVEPAGLLGDRVGDPRNVPDQDVGLHVAHRLEQIPGAELADLVEPESASVLPRRLHRPLGQVDPVYLGGAELRGDDREDPAAATDVDHGVSGRDLDRIGERAAGRRRAEDTRTEVQGEGPLAALPEGFHVLARHRSLRIVGGKGFRVNTPGTSGRRYTSGGSTVASGPAPSLPVSTASASASSRAASRPVAIPRVPSG